MTLKIGKQWQFNGQRAQTAKNNDIDSQGEVQKFMVPKEIEEIPDGYLDEPNQPGTLTDLYYDTYESFSHNKWNNPQLSRLWIVPGGGV
jgi:hypothetical protein